MANLKKLDDTINELEKQSNELKEFNAVYSEINNLKKELLESLVMLRISNKNFSEIADKIDAKLTGSLLKMDEVYKDNKSFQKELDSSLVSRLDKVKSDLQVEMRNEGTQSQKNLESVIYSNFNQLKFEIKETADYHSKRMDRLKLLIIGVAILFIVLFYFGMIR